jgi:hypothetical protein
MRPRTTEVVATRLAPETIQQLDRIVLRERAARPHAQVGRADVIREIIAVALSQRAA